MKYSRQCNHISYRNHYDVYTGTGIATRTNPKFHNIKKKFSYSMAIAFQLVWNLICFINNFHNDKFVEFDHLKIPILQRYRTFTAVNILLSYFSLVTSLKLLIDPYDSGEYFEMMSFRKIFYILHSLRFACLTSSFCLIEISIIEVTKLYPILVKSKRVIYCVIFLHLIIVLTLSCYLVFGANMTVLVVVCEGSTLVFGIAVVTVTIFATFKILCYSARSKSFLKHDNEINMNYVNPKLNRGSNISPKSSFERKVSKTEKVKQQANILKKTLENENLRRITIISSLTAIFGLLISVQTLYSMVDVDVFSMDTPDSLKWYISQTIGKLAEVCMVTTMAVTVQTKNRKMRKIFERTSARLTKGFSSRT